MSGRLDSNSTAAYDTSFSAIQGENAKCWNNTVQHYKKNYKPQTMVIFVSYTWD